jgi:hypothetical protein
MTEFCLTTHKSEPNDQNFSFKGTHIAKERRSSVFDRKKTVTDFRKSKCQRTLTRRTTTDHPSWTSGKIILNSYTTKSRLALISQKIASLRRELFEPKEISRFPRWPNSYDRRTLTMIFEIKSKTITHRDNFGVPCTNESASRCQVQNETSII